MIVDNKLLNNSVLSFLTIGRLFPGVLKHHETNFFPRLSPEAVNFVTLTMRANTKRQACETALYKPDPADQTTWITDARSLFVCPMAGWSILLQLFSLTVLAALVCKYRDPAKPGSGYAQNLIERGAGKLARLRLELVMPCNFDAWYQWAEKEKRIHKVCKSIAARMLCDNATLFLIRWRDAMSNQRRLKRAQRKIQQVCVRVVN